MSTLRMGTCSWKYDSWRGIIYSDNKPINYLEEYARFYPTVEVDQWFWSLFGVDKVTLPSPFTVREFRDSVSEDFKFSIKVPNSITLTHFYRKTQSDPLQENPHFLSVSLFEDFLRSIKPIKNRLGPLMFQFEYLNKQKMSGLDELLEKLDNFFEKIDRSNFYALELRNPNYLSDRYFHFLNRQKVGHVFLQGYYMPPITGVYQSYRQYIGGTTIIRLHGPDRSNIEKLSGGNWNRILIPRDEELEQIAQIVRELLNRNVEIYVNMNNHYEGSAPLSLKRLEKLLQSQDSSEE